MNEQTEVWKDCAESARLQVSNIGRVKRDGILQTLKTKQGYLHVWDGERDRLVHRLVASAFCSQPVGCDVVNHLDGSRDNNHASNLEWTTPGDNTRHAAENDMLATGERHTRSELTEALVLEIDAMLRGGIPNGTIAEQAGVSREVVSKIKAGRTWGKVTGRALAPIERKGAVGKPKLTPEQVTDIRCKVGAGESMRAVAASYGMSHTTVSAIVNGDTWKQE